METKDGLLLLYSFEETTPWYEHFLYGVEEEGIPIYCIDSKKEDLPVCDAIALAKVSAHYSCFDLGIGADERELVVCHRLQNNDIPLIKILRSGECHERMRRAGHNTARIIKSVPLILDD